MSSSDRVAAAAKRRIPAKAQQVAASARRKAYVDAARDLFLQHGYSGATMSEISRVVGGSKTTLWTYFGSKEELFEAVLDVELEKNIQAFAIDASLEKPLEAALMEFGCNLLASLYAREFLSLHRIVIGEAERFPYIAKIFHERAAARHLSRLQQYLEVQADRWPDEKWDCRRLAEDFVAACQLGCGQMALLGLVPPLDARQRETSVRRAVQIFSMAVGWGRSCGPIDESNGTSVDCEAS